MSKVDELKVFCAKLVRDYNARFNTQKTHSGLRVVIEFYARDNQLVTTDIEVTRAGFNTKVYNGQRRLIHTGFRPSILDDKRLLDCLTKEYLA